MIFGEVQTGLLQNSVALGQQHVSKILDLLEAERVRRAERPISFAVSAELLTGIDCQLPHRSRKGTRCIGTVTSHTSITGGHVLQGSSHTRVGRAIAHTRVPWSEYLARPGEVDIIGKMDADDIADGFVTAADRPGVVNIGAISERVVDSVQRSPLLDRRPPFRSRRTRMRWIVRSSAEQPAHPRGTFRVESDNLRLLRLTVSHEQLPEVVGLCEDLALHDWLLTTLLSLMESGFTSPATHSERINRLQPAIDHLFHLWMPSARVGESVHSVWDALERRPGFTRQWEVAVSRIRDQVSLTTIALLRDWKVAQSVRKT